MAKIDRSQQGSTLEQVSGAIARGIGTTRGFMIGLAIIAGFFLWGTHSNFDEHWHLNLHTVISLITFILIFITARVEQKDMIAVQLKLNELLAAKEGASNDLINADKAAESELKEAHEAYDQVADNAQSTEAVSIEHKNSLHKAS